MPKWIAAAFILPALFGAIMIYSYRDVVFYWDFADPVGDFVVEKDEQLLELANKFIEEKNPGLSCTSQWFGRDEKYLYLRTNCAATSGDLEQVKSAWSKPVRVEWDLEKRTMVGMQTPAEGADEAKSYRSLFPKLAYALGR